MRSLHSVMLSEILLKPSAEDLAVLGEAGDSSDIVLNSMLNGSSLLSSVIIG